MEDEVRFSKEQINALENMLKGDIVPLINTEIRNNYIPKLLVEEILKECKKQKEEASTHQKDVFVVTLLSMVDMLQVHRHGYSYFFFISH